MSNLIKPLALFLLFYAMDPLSALKEHILSFGGGNNSNI